MQYELAKRWRSVNLEDIEDLERYRSDPFRHGYQDSGKWYAKQSRDILFVERNLECLKPGGRMAIVLPQGRFNNISDATLRAYISSHCRILAVVGLDNNTFKPHTGTKTSLLFVQKWNDDPAAGPLCPRVDDYPIFFATSHQSGKDNSGNYVYRTDDLGNRVLDSHGHLIIEHDLNDIAAAFVLFAKEQGFPFWKDVDRPFLRRPDGELWTLQAFTEGAETTAVWSKVPYQELAGTSRVDAEYYQPHLLNAELALEKAGCPIVALGSVVKDGYRVVYENTAILDEEFDPCKHVKFLQAADIRPVSLS